MVIVAVTVIIVGEAIVVVFVAVCGSCGELRLHHHDNDDSSRQFSSLLPSVQR